MLMRSMLPIVSKKNNVLNSTIFGKGFIIKKEKMYLCSQNHPLFKFRIENSCCREGSFRRVFRIFLESQINSSYEKYSISIYNISHFIV